MSVDFYLKHEFKKASWIETSVTYAGVEDANYWCRLFAAIDLHITYFET